MAERRRQRLKGVPSSASDLLKAEKEFELVSLTKLYGLHVGKGQALAIVHETSVRAAPTPSACVYYINLSAVVDSALALS